MLTAYVGAALTGAPPEFVKGFLPLLKKKIRKIQIEVLDFIGLEAGTALVVFRHDRKCTENADICVFILDHPSTGLGMEIMLRAAAGKPALFFARRGVRVTRMLLGFLEERGIKVHRYRSAIGICRVLRISTRRIIRYEESLLVSQTAKSYRHFVFVEISEILTDDHLQDYYHEFDKNEVVRIFKHYEVEMVNRIINRRVFLGSTACVA